MPGLVDKEGLAPQRQANSPASQRRPPGRNWCCPSNEGAARRQRTRRRWAREDRSAARRQSAPTTSLPATRRGLERRQEGTGEGGGCSRGGHSDPLWEINEASASVHVNSDRMARHIDEGGCALTFNRAAPVAAWGQPIGASGARAFLGKHSTRAAKGAGGG